MDLNKLLENQLRRNAVGTLTLHTKNRFREIFFEEGLVYLVGESFSGKISTAGLYCSDPPVPLPTLDTILVSADLKRQLLQEILRDQGLIEGATLVGLTTQQVLEEVIDLFLHNTASFHFQEGRVPEALLGCERLVASTPVKLTNVVEEYQARHEELTSIRESIPDDGEVFVLTSEGEAYKKTHSDDYVLQRVLDAFDGTRELRNVFKDCPFFEHQVLHVIAEAMRNGHLKKTIHPELKGFSTSDLTQEEAEQFLPALKNAVKYGIDELAARERLAAVFERLGRVDDAVIQFNFIGDALYRMEKPAKSVKAYQRALELKPGETLLIEKIISIYSHAAQADLVAGNIKSAQRYLESALKIQPSNLAVFKQLAELYSCGKRYKELADAVDLVRAHATRCRQVEPARLACQAAIELAPTKATFRKKLINIFLDFGCNSEAAAAMSELAGLYRDAGETESALALEEKVDRLREAGKGRTKTRRSSENPKRRPRGRNVRAESDLQPRRRGGRLLRGFGVLVLLVLAYQTWSLVAWQEIERKYAHAETLRDGVTHTGVAPTQLKKNEESLIQDCETFLKYFPVSVFRTEVSELRHVLRRNLEDLTVRRNLTVQQILAEAERLGDQEGDFMAALRILDRVEPSSPYHLKAVALRERFNEPIADSPHQLLERGGELEEQELWVQACAIYKELLERYPTSASAKKVAFPIELRSYPPGATAYTLEGEDLQELGESPVVLRLPPGSKQQVELRFGDAYVPKRVWIDTNPPVGGSLGTRRVMLGRKPQASYRIPAPLASAPKVDGVFVYCASTDGRVFSVDLSSGKISGWARDDGVGKRLVAPPLAVEERIVTAWDDAVLGVLHNQSGILSEHRRLPLPRPVAPGALELAAAPAMVVVGTDASQLQAYDLSGTATENVWSVDLPGRASVIRALRSDNAAAVDLLVGMSNGMLLRVSVERTRPSLRWKYSLGARPVTRIALVGDIVVATTQEKDWVHYVDLAGSAPRRVPLERAVRVAFCEKTQRALALDAEGTLTALAPRQGDESTQHRVAEFLQSEPSEFEGLGDGTFGIVHDGDQEFLLLEVIGDGEPKPLWATRVEAGIAHTVTDGSYVVLAGKDGTLHVFPRR